MTVAIRIPTWLDPTHVVHVTHKGVREYQHTMKDGRLFVNFPKAVPPHYLRYLHNGFRNAWSFMGSPIRIRIRSSRDS